MIPIRPTLSTLPVDGLVDSVGGRRNREFLALHRARITSNSSGTSGRRAHCRDETFPVDCLAIDRDDAVAVLKPGQRARPSANSESAVVERYGLP